MTAEGSTENMSFEDALKRLEGIVRELESGDVPLDRAITLYEEGESLRKLCEARLSAAEVRIRELQVGPDGVPAGSRPFAA